MKDTMKILRMACYDLLNGNLTYAGQTVPVGDEKLRDNARANLFVVFGTQQETPDDTSDAFITDSQIDIEIYHKTGFEVSKDAIDDVSNQILEILIPTPYGGDGFLVQNLFQINCVRRLSSVTRNFSVTDSQSVISKIITITCKIVQQFP